MVEAARAAEHVARTSYGRLVAFLATRTRDISSAEDALSEAFCAALETWPRTGIPSQPEAWLLTAARRRLIDDSRRRRVHESATNALQLVSNRAVPNTDTLPGTADLISDDRLRLLFACAHPAIEPGMHAPLMLQTVLGLDAGRIASAFLTAPATMSQRLVRVKAKIRDAGIPFEIPDHSVLSDRLASVLDAIYAAYTSGWDEASTLDGRGKELADEALYLARLVVALLPEEPEARGLLALILFCESRRDARRSQDGSYVPLTLQDTSQWSKVLLAEAEQQLTIAFSRGVAGRFQTEAAIQAIHAAKRLTGSTNWNRIVVLYRALTGLTGTVGAYVGLAAALSEAGDPTQAIHVLD
ncbi:MAG: RNA polymerase subunit sigma-70, partial [Bryobacteraceae bacterium]|nr:RNA polymerase subunit sigma-70 [Bryobacteraceae bacterium]